MYERLKELNDHFPLRKVSDKAFSPYGKIIVGYDFEEIIAYARDTIGIPEKGNRYVASDQDLESFSIKHSLENTFYGEMPIQIGYCNGKNSTLNGLEYHRGSEIDVAVTDLVLMLGRIQDVYDNQYDVRNVEVFFVPQGTAVQLYETTLHFSPCKIEEEGFKCLVILPKGTNLPLEKESPGIEDKLLFAKNKWLMVHPLNHVLRGKGAYPGIIGENMELRIG